MISSGCADCGRRSWYLWRRGICGTCCNAEDERRLGPVSTRWEGASVNEQIEEMLRDTAGIGLWRRQGGVYAVTLEEGGGEREWGSGATVEEALAHLYEAFARPPEDE